jgi:hypothetical protein
MNIHSKRELTKTEREKYSLAETDRCEVLIFEKITEERADQFEYELEDQGHEVLDSVLSRVATSIYNVEIFVKYN